MSLSSWRIVLTLLILGSLAALGALGADGHDQLIAHRGGVVEDKFPDNSLAALHAAVARGYRGIECDIRETKDGVLVMQHDPDLRQNFGDARKIAETTWAELSHLRTTHGAQPLYRFEDWVKAAHDAGVTLMLDSKDPHAPDFPAKVETILRRYDMLDRCYIVGTADAMNHFAGKALVGYKFNALQARIEADPTAKDRIFLFDESRNLTAEKVRWAQAHGVRVIPSINVYHYYDPKTMAGKSRPELEAVILPQAQKHITALQALGVTEFQIDSEFDRWF